MSKLLTIDEMLAVLTNMQHSAAPLIRRSVECLADQMAEVIGEALDVSCGSASYEMDCGGTCVPFYAKKIGQPCPEPMRDFDSTEWTLHDDDFTSLDPDTGAVLA